MQLIFSFPPDGPDRVAIHQDTQPIPKTNIVETYYVLTLTHQGEDRIFRLPHDIEELWKLLTPNTNPSTAPT